MPETQAHQNKQSRTHLALSNLQQSQNSPLHADWIVILAFYKALHAVDSYLAKLDVHPKGHRNRIEEVQKRLNSLYPQYSAPYDASIQARYEAYTYQDNPEDVLMLVNSSRSIEDYVNTLLEVY